MKAIVREFPGLAALFCLIVTGLCFAPGKVAHAQTTPKVRERVDTIIKETLKRGEFTTAQGVKVITRTAPSAKDVEEIKSYGDRAVMPLQEHFYSENAFEYEIAMRLMGELGGKRIIGPFKKLALEDPSARKREFALRWITRGPWAEASKVISHAAENDPDASVRKVAEELLSGHGP